MHPWPTSVFFAPSQLSDCGSSVPSVAALYTEILTPCWDGTEAPRVVNLLVLWTRKDYV